MQISTPTQALDSPAGGDSPRESGKIENFSTGSSGSWSQKTQKKNKPGIFAKLLEGLAVKNTRGNDKSGNAGETGKHKKPTEQVLLPGHDTRPVSNDPNPKEKLKTAVNAKMAVGPEFSGAGVIPHRGWNPAEAIANKNTKEENFPALKGKEISRLTGSSHPTDTLYPTDTLHPTNTSHPTGASHLADTSHLTDALQKGKKQAAANAAEISDGKEEPGRLVGSGNSVKQAPSGEDDAKGAARGTQRFLSFSFRDMESRFAQSLGSSNPEIAGPGLKSTVKGAAGEKEDPPLTETRGKKGKLNIDVRDLRTKTEHAYAGETGNQAQVKEASAQKQAITEIEIPVNLEGKAGKGESGASLFTGKETPGRFEDALAAELRGNLSPDIVRDAMVIVRNGGDGTIRLSLHPASLGNVKIRLEMTENKITGHIVLESNEAFRAFERELPVLEKAFRDSGFSETNLQMSFAQDGGNFSGREQRQEGELQALAPVQAASRYESGSEWIDTGTTVLPFGEMKASTGRTPVNLLV